jgi:hypothetical protein
MVIHAYNPSTREVEAGVLRVQGQPGLHSELKASMGYIASPCLKLKQTNKKKLLLWV